MKAISQAKKVNTTCLKAVAILALLITVPFFPVTAHAAEGAVKVDCPANNCDLVTLGQICNTMAPGSEPIGLSCENTATPGRGTPTDCGTRAPNGRIGTCTPFGGLIKSDLLGSYCFGSTIGGANDAVVICDTTPEALREVDIEEGKDPSQ